MSRLFCLFALSAALAPAQTSKPAMLCGDLRALTAGELTIATAIQIPASPSVPEHCRVNGQILPEIAFEVNLPSSWNGRLLMFGNGGFAGEPVDGPPRLQQRSRAIQAGFASAVTDTGHSEKTEPLASFAVNRQKLLDYAFRSLHLTALAAKRIVAAYYGAPPARAYFEGCSTGGRQGLILAQRFPSDFDGIIVGAPVLDFTGTMIAGAVYHQALAAAPIPVAKLKTLAERIYAKCDAADGIADGVIDDPRRCDFQPARDLAADFTPEQIHALETIYSDITVAGKRRFPGWPPGAEAAGRDGRSGWDPWFIREGGQSIMSAFAESFFRYMAFPQKDPARPLSAFDLERDAARLESIHLLLDATDTDLSAFERRGGKILMYYGWADPALNPRMGIEYFERAASPNFFRLFMVPGMFHCGGGPGPNSFDSLHPLLNWVENGAAPDSITASTIVDGKPTRTRPLCPYPQIAKYKGDGSTDDAANFRCAAP